MGADLLGDEGSPLQSQELRFAGSINGGRARAEETSARPSAAARSEESVRNTQPVPLQTVPLHELWSKFASGTLRVERVQYILGRCFVHMSHRIPTRPPATTTEWRIAERILSGDQPKVVADELSLARSTVCGHWKTAIAELCASTASRQAQAFLVLCAGSKRNPHLAPALVHGLDDAGHSVVSFVLDDKPLEEAGLSPAESAIAKAVIRGKAVPAICAERSTSPRTVANQLSSIYRKLRVSGRRELILATLVRDKTTRTPSAVQRAWLD